MNKNECSACGSDLSTKEKYCKYCGSINPFYKENLKLESRISDNKPQKIELESDKNNNKFAIFIILLVLTFVIAFTATYLFIKYM